LEFFIEKNVLTMLHVITQRIDNVNHNKGLTHKCIKVISTSHLSTQSFKLIIWWVQVSHMLVRGGFTKKWMLIEMAKVYLTIFLFIVI
jgi:hypothetical protein